jgi:hypothetical protein
VLTSDVTAAGTIYYTPYIGGAASVYNGSLWKTLPLSELSLTLDATSAHTGYHQSGHNFDLFVAEDPSNLNQLIFGSGPAWSSDTARGTGAGTTELQMLGGLQVNKNSMSLHKSDGSNVTIAANCATCVGSFRASADGQTQVKFGSYAAGGGEAWLGLWNMYNRTLVAGSVRDTVDSWTYSTATIRAANGSATMRMSALCGLNEDAISATFFCDVSLPSTSGSSTGVGLDTTTAFTGQIASVFYNGSSTVNEVMSGNYQGLLGLGFHYISANEYTSIGSPGPKGDGGTPATVQSGLTFNWRN